MPAGTARDRSPSLRRTWLAGTLVMVALLVGFGALALASSAYQRDSFRQTSEQLERSSTALVELRLALNKLSAPAAEILRPQPATDVDSRALDVYLQLSREIGIRFHRVHEAAPAAARASVETARQKWVQTDHAVRQAAVVPEAVAPAAVWSDYAAVPQLLADVERSHITALQEQTAAVDRTQALIPRVLLGAVLVSLLTIGVAARRISRRVVAPVAALRRAALAMRDAELREPIDVRGASCELQELARTIEETATILKGSHDELHEQAHTDSLTGLPNRKAFVEELTRRFTASSDRLGVLFLDLDDFKVVNDSHGHAAGDELLVQVAARLRGALRSTDVVARLGGDEFAVLVDCARGTSVATTVARTLLAALVEPVVADGHRLVVECSVGVATGGGGAGTPDDLLGDADFAMYMAKGRGKGCVETFAPSMHLAVQAQLELKRDLGHAVERGELVLHHQPVVEPHTGRLLGTEALVRWQHPTRGLLLPGAFLEMAEETGDVVALGGWVLEQACLELAQHRSRLSPDGDLWVSVNVSSQQLACDAFVDQVLAALRRHRVPHGSLVLEITEHAAVANPVAATQSLEVLRRAGVRVALDDFGVGFSSLRYLRELPVDVLKIDRTFVVDGSDRSVAMLSALVSLARGLGLDVIAEGVEEPADLHRLLPLGPLAVQGFLLARPAPLEDLHPGPVLPPGALPKQRTGSSVRA